MIELVFSLLLTASDADHKYEHCHRPNRCQMLNAVQYSVASIRNGIHSNFPRFSERFTCRFNIQITPSGHLKSVSMLECDEKYSPHIFQAITAAAPFKIMPEAYSQIKDINMTFSHEF